MAAHQADQTTAAHLPPIQRHALQVISRPNKFIGHLEVNCEKLLLSFSEMLCETTSSSGEIATMSYCSTSCTKEETLTVLPT